MFQNTFNLMEDLCTRKGNNIITCLKKGKLKLKSSFYFLLLIIFIDLNILTNSRLRKMKEISNDFRIT